ncbi:MAG TPA: helix-turn-helix domain-containing protein [Acidimicrobiales bacterium]|nr:helix-turn-helix domain-containing protein [Acidimicrobiales bacterium]
MNDAIGDAFTQILAEALARVLPGVVDQLAVAGGPRAYSVAQVAERLSVSDSTVLRHIRAGHLRTVPHLSPQRISAHALEEFLAGDRWSNERRAS